MAAETLDQFIARLKAEHERSSPNTLEFFLKQIRELAKHGQEAEEKVKTGEISSGEAQRRGIEQARTKTPQEARAELIKDSVQETTTQPNRLMIGQMVFYAYFPKGVMTLKYWDEFPLVYPFSIHGNSMTGINLHYLPYVERARLMMGLMMTANSKRLDEHTKLRISYQILNQSTKYSYFRPCIKKYLFSHIRSRIMVISPNKWNSVLFMPIAGFHKSTEYRVWKDSIDIIRKKAFHDR